MMRRTFRLGLRAGLLAGIVFALVKLMQARRSSQDDVAPSSTWPPVPAPKPTPTPTPTPMEADEPGMERPAGFARTATVTAPPAPNLGAKPRVSAEPSGSTPAPSMTPAPTANAASSAPGTVTQQPAGRVRPLK